MSAIGAYTTSPRLVGSLSLCRSKVMNGENGCYNRQTELHV